MQKKQVKEGAKALGSLFRKYLKRIQDRLLTPLAHLTTLGKSIAATAAGVALLCGGLIVFDASHLNLETGEMAVITGRTVNVRQSPTTKAKVLTQTHRGDRFEVVGSKKKWKNIRSMDGKFTGWVAGSLIETKTGRTFVYRYDMKGYILVLLFAVAAFVAALRLKESKGSKD
jgi:SH3-like domain-containing protein